MRPALILSSHLYLGFPTRLYSSGCRLLLQSALHPLWVLAYSTIAEYSHQEGFYIVPLPGARQTPNLEDQWLERSNSRHQASPTPETTRANPSCGRWNYGRENREFCRKWRLPRHFWVLLHAVNLRHGTDGITSAPKVGALRIFFARKIRRLRPGSNPGTSGCRLHFYIKF